MTQARESHRTAWERVFVRHLDEDHRLDIAEVEAQVKAPFPTCSGSSGGAPILCKPSATWLIGLKIDGQSWMPLFSNAADTAAIFKSAAKGRRLEVVWAGYEPEERGWFFQLTRARKPVVDFALRVKHADQLAKAKFKSTVIDASLLEGCTSGHEALDRLCRQFGVDPAACELEYSAREFRVVDAHGRPRLNDLLGYFGRTGYAINRGDSPASDALCAAIERCDPEAIRQAATEGARLDVLPDTMVSPLMSALYKCMEPKGKDCVAALVELGCSVNGDPSDDPTIINCVAHFLGEDLPLEMVRTIVPLGVDVNAVSPYSGNTALHDAVVYPRIELVRFLLTHGSDPTIQNFRSLSPIDWLTKRLKEVSGDDEERRKYAEILSLLTGEPVDGIEATPQREWLAVDRTVVVRQQIAQCLGIDPLRVTPNASFIDDLGGGPEHLRVLRLGIEQAMGVSIEPVVDAINARTEIDDQGKVTYDSLGKIQSYLPGWSDPLQPTPFSSMFTVSMIEAMIAKAIEEKAAAEAAAHPSLAPEHSATVRKMIADHAGVAVESLTPQTNMIRDLKMSDRTLGLLLALLQLELDSEILPIWHEIQLDFRMDEQGRLGEGSRRRLQQILPGAAIETNDPASLDDLFTVGTLEAVASKALAKRPADLPFESITSTKQQEWVRQLPQELGDRKLRLLLAGGCRYVLRTRLNSTLAKYCLTL
jgi:hypothetical protein